MDIDSATDHERTNELNYAEDIYYLQERFERVK